MSVSTKELFTAFFKGLAFAKGLNFGDKNRGMAEDRWITIHPGGDPDVNRRIEIDDEGYILKGFGNKIVGTNLKDLSANLKAIKNGEQPIKMDKDGNRVTEQAKPKSRFPNYKAPEKKAEEKSEKKFNFRDKVKEIVSQEFKYAPGTSAMGEFDAKYLEKQLNKLDPNEEGVKEALEEVDKAVKSGDMRQVIYVQNAISHFANDKEKYKRSLKATRDSYKKAIRLYDDLINKLKKVDTKPIMAELKTKAKEFWDNHNLNINDVDKALKNLKESSGLGKLSRKLHLSDQYFTVLEKVAFAKNQLQHVLDRTEKFNAAKDPLYQLKLAKEYVTKPKSEVKDYFNQHNMAMDSADFAEIQTLLNELDSGNNSLDLFINKVNIER